MHNDFAVIQAAGNTGARTDSTNPQIPTRPAIRPTPLYIDYSYARVA